MLDTLLVAGILVVDALILYVEWTVADYQKRYWKSRSDWYAARGKRVASADAAAAPSPSPEGAENVERKG